MPTDKPLAYLELLKKLKKFNIEITERGNKCFLFHPNINGNHEYYTLHKPHRKGEEYSRHIISAIRRRFNISWDHFYNQ